MLRQVYEQCVNVNARTLTPRPRPRDPLACAGEETERDRERSGMVDLRAEISSLSDKTEFTETKDQSRTHQSHIGTPPLQAWTGPSVRSPGAPEAPLTAPDGPKGS